MRLASSWTVIASGTTTSRTCLACGPACWRRCFSFSRARLSAARAGRARRHRRRARVTVSLPDWRRSSPGLLSDAPASGRLARALAARRAFAARLAVASRPRRRRRARRLGRRFAPSGSACLPRGLASTPWRLPASSRPCDFLGAAAFVLARALASSSSRRGLLRARRCGLLGLAQQMRLEFLASAAADARRRLRAAVGTAGACASGAARARRLARHLASPGRPACGASSPRPPPCSSGRG